MLRNRAAIKIEDFRLPRSLRNTKLANCLHVSGGTRLNHSKYYLASCISLTKLKKVVTNWSQDHKMVCIGGNHYSCKKQQIYNLLKTYCANHAAIGTRTLQPYWNFLIIEVHIHPSV